MLYDFLQDIDNYEERKVSRTELENGLKIDTAYTSDEGYETAISDITEDWFPVERYGTKEESEAGHKKWVEFAKTNPVAITRVGWSGLLDDEEIELSYLTANVEGERK